jgi:hypothetical protein
MTTARGVLVRQTSPPSSRADLPSARARWRRRIRALDAWRCERGLERLDQITSDEFRAADGGKQDSARRSSRARAPHLPFSEADGHMHPYAYRHDCSSGGTERNEDSTECERRGISAAEAALPERALTDEPCDFRPGVSRRAKLWLKWRGRTFDGTSFATP